MKQNVKLHNRKSVRCATHDYTDPGPYFITINTHDRIRLFGSVQNKRMCLSRLGQIVMEEWAQIPQHRNNVVIVPAESIAMPDHFHGILWIIESEVEQTFDRCDDYDNHGELQFKRALPRRFSQPQSGSVHMIVNAFKGAVTRRAREEGLIASNQKLWQRGYHDRIIRTQSHLNATRQYVLNNPAKWKHGRAP